MNTTNKTAGLQLLLSSFSIAAEAIEESKTWTESFPLSATEPLLEIHWPFRQGSNMSSQTVVTSIESNNTQPYA